MHSRYALIRYQDADEKTWRVGSGLIVRDRAVLTADHIADGTKHRVEYADRKISVESAVRSGTADVDLAVLVLAEPVSGLTALSYARVDRTHPAKLHECFAVGFPFWKKDGDRRLTAQVEGYMRTGDDLGMLAAGGTDGQLLTLIGDRGPGDPDLPLGKVDYGPGSPWAGMSGAVVVRRDMAIGVIHSHHLAKGFQSLTVTPLTALKLLPPEKYQQFCAALGIEGIDQMTLLTGDTRPVTAAELAMAATAGTLVSQRHKTTNEIALGKQGREALGEALASLGTDHTTGPRSWTAAALRQLENELAGRPDSTALQRVQQTISDALVALETGSLLQTRHDLDSGRLCQALVALRVAGSLPVSSPRRPTVIEAVETVAFGYSSDEPDCRRSMARFVMLLLPPDTSLAGGAAAADGDPEQLRSWADHITRAYVNDAARFVQTLRRGQHLRLVIRLHASLNGDRPESLETWLRVDGQPQSLEHEFFSLPPFLNSAGADQALAEGLDRALDWALGIAEDLDLELRRVDIAAPTALLLSWHPEEVVVGGSKLGVHYDVVAHWSRRLDPPGMMRWIMVEAFRRLENIDGHTAPAAPVEWLEAGHTAQVDHLSGRLHAGVPECAIGLDHRPSPEVMELLFSYSPVVLWPRSAAGFPASLRSRLDHIWDTLPAGFLRAYREHWKERHETDGVADLRAVWDDRDWLDFCRASSRQAGRNSGGAS